MTTGSTGPFLVGAMGFAAAPVPKTFPQAVVLLDGFMRRVALLGRGELPARHLLQPARCRYDGGAVFRIAWKEQDFSPLDYGHLSIAGQRTLASTTWKATFSFTK